MRLTIVSVGHKMPDWVATATQDYIKRMPTDCSIDIKEIKPDLTPAKEAVIILAAIQNLATELANWRQEGFDITFLIGGADGLDADLKKNAQAMWRLSSLTMPHAMARVLLVEQLYRAWTILQGHPYHRE